jgi:hypothetical protein
MLIRGGGKSQGDTQLNELVNHGKLLGGCQSTLSGATNGSMISGSEANNLNKFLDIQINKNKLQIDVPSQIIN